MKQVDINVKITVNVGDRTKEECPFDVVKVLVNGREVEKDKSIFDQGCWDLRPNLEIEDGVLLHLVQEYY